MKILTTWIGHADLRALAQASDSSVRDEVGQLLSTLAPPAKGEGPVKALLEEMSFDRIVVLSNYPESITRRFVAWLPQEAESRLVSLDDPTDYAEVFRIARDCLDALAHAMAGAPCNLFLHLSPGTPAMAAVWVLLGKTLHPATFIQTFGGGAVETSIPFDLTLDVVPELLRNPDSNLQNLAAHRPADVPGFEGIAGASHAIRLAVGRARKAAIRDVPVLLLGESGTGKEMFARAIHATSRRREGPFITVNCGALPPTLLESELFGHEKNAFTGASRHYRGAFEQAHEGTLFLDEIGECSPDLQVKLLRVLQPPEDAAPCTRRLRRLGSETEFDADVRVVAATNRDLIQQVKEEKFREDLFYRLAVITLRLPPLRERTSDVPVIADALLAQINKDFARTEPAYCHKSLSDSALSFMVSRSWPGNVRQLYNCLVQAAVMSEAEQLHASDLEAAAFELDMDSPRDQQVLDCPLGGNFSIESHLEDIQRHFLRRAMREANGVKVKAARFLGIQNYQTLDAQLKRLGVEWAKNE